MTDRSNYSLRQHNTFGIEASCDRFIEYESEQEAVAVAPMLKEQPFLIIGGGSNLLLTSNLHGIVVRSAIMGITRKGNTVSCGSGERWDNVVKYCVENNLYGAENLSLIPGDVGATAVQNIGAYGTEVSELIDKVHAVEINSGRECVLEASDCHYAYRDSRFKHEWKNRYLITRVDYRLSHTYQPRLDYGNIRLELEARGIDSPTASQLRQVVIDIRREKLPDPDVTGNAGSFFMNPVVSREKYEQLAAANPQMPHYHVDADHEKIPAGWLIDQCGWKGRSLGPAGVHDRQALVLVNRGGATGADIVKLCQAIQHDVNLRFGISITPEVNIV